eukprot:8391593-Pyramimonas_sp.AAC.1
MFHTLGYLENVGLLHQEHEHGDVSSASEANPKMHLGIPSWQDNVDGQPKLATDQQEGAPTSTSSCARPSTRSS